MGTKTNSGIWPTLLVYFFSAASLLCGAARAADTQPLILEHLTIADGLPQGTVMTTLQDSQGFVWLGTQDGLVRYDGHDLHHYAFSRSNPSGLPGNFIYEIAEDAHHDLWLAIKGAGVARWNRRSDDFTVFRHDAANAGSLASDNASSLIVDTQGMVWVGTDETGLDRIDPATGRVEHFAHDAGDPASLIDDRVLTLAQDSTGTLWVGTRSGLDRWRGGAHAFDHFQHSAQPHSLSGNQISNIAEDRNGTLWIATNDAGLNRMNRDGTVEQVFRHDAHNANSIVSDDVRAVLEDQAGHLWVGTPDGLDLLDRPSGEFSHYRSDDRDPESLRDSYIMSLYEDGAGLMWIGTRSGGVSRWNPRSWEFGGHRPAWLADKLVTSFADAPDNKVWIGSFGGGLTRFDADTGEAVSLDRLVGRSNAIGDNRVMSLRLDHKGNLWIGTMRDGLKKLTPGGRISTISAKSGEANSLSRPGIMTIFEARTGQIWVGTFGGGANVIDPQTGVVRQLPYGEGKSGAISAPNVMAIAEDSYGNMWIGTGGGGLNLARADGSVIGIFRHDPNDPQSLPSNNVYSITVDTQGRVWIGTGGGGMARVIGSAAEPGAIRFQVFTREQGLSSDTIYGAVTDSSSQLWLSGNAGLIRLDPERGSIKTFHREHGLQGEEFNTGAWFRLRDGRLAFGGPGGFNIFDPSRLTENSNPPRLALTNIDVMGVPVASKTPFWLQNNIVLDYGASIVSLDFGALDFTSPKRNRIAYRMAGLTDNWIDLGTQRRVTLTNLDAGDHVLEVRAANSDSVWSVTPLQITLHRNPAPWRSPWAYAIYVLLALGLIAYRVHAARMKFRRVVESQRRLEVEVQLRTHELVESNRKLEEAARAKSNFLDRMSHELRTPMNGVVGMTELLARTSLSSTQSRLTQTIRNSAQVLLRIVNDLLDLSKVQAGKLELEQLPINLGRIVEECAALFAGSAESKGIELVACPPAHEDLVLLGDPLRIRQIVMNLIGNAVKFTSQGEVVIKADILTVEGGRANVQISVSDTGIGMDAKTIDRIFEPFTQADESTTRRFGGSGLGLAICRELAQVMQGSIGVDSRPQSGSTFRLLLPLNIDASASLDNGVAAAGPVATFASGAALRGRSVRILTRRPALTESLERHAEALGLVVARELRESTMTRRPDILIVDAGCQQDLARLQAEQSGLQAPTLVVASEAEIESRSLALLFRPECLVAKPVQRDALRESLMAAIAGPGALPAAPKSAAAPRAALSGHVLLVEDEPVNAAVAEGYLEALGCTSVWVKDGVEAVARSGAERFELILMDLSMPKMDGFATTALIRAQQSGPVRVPIIALTAHDVASYRDQCIAAGMDDMLTKPYTLEECRSMLQRWLPDSTPYEGLVAIESAPNAAIDQQQLALAGVDDSAVMKLRSLRSGGKGDFFGKLVELFRCSSADTLAEMNVAMTAGNLRESGRLAHKLAGSAANVGAITFATCARKLEKACAAGTMTEAVHLNEQLQKALPDLIGTLISLRLEASA